MQITNHKQTVFSMHLNEEEFWHLVWAINGAKDDGHPLFTAQRILDYANSLIVES